MKVLVICSPHVSSMASLEAGISGWRSAPGVQGPTAWWCREAVLMVMLSFR